MVQQPIQQRGGDDRIAEDFAPLDKAAIGCENHGALFVAGEDELEEQVGGAGRDRQISDLVDDEQRRPGEEANLFPERAIAYGLGELGDQIGERDEVDALSGPHGLDRQRRGNMAFPGAWRAQQVNDFGPLDDVEGGKRRDAVPVERRLEREVVACQRLHHRQTRHAQGRL